MQLALLDRFGEQSGQLSRRAVPLRETSHARYCSAVPNSSCTPNRHRLIRITTALAVVAVAGVAAIISYQHAYELVRSHGESGVTARLLPFTVDGLIWAASMLSGVCRGVV